MIKSKNIVFEERTKKFIEYCALMSVNNTVFADGLIDEKLRDRVAQKRKSEYKAYRSA